MQLNKCSELVIHINNWKAKLVSAFDDRKIRRDDLEFHTAVREWSTTIGNGDVAGYHNRFEYTRSFFADRIPEGMRRSGELIRMLSETS